MQDAYPIMKTSRTISDYIFDLTAYLFIPASTILFAKGNNWFTTNFSVLGSSLDRKNAFTLWGLLVGVYFFCILHHISRKIIPALKGTSLISISLLLLVCAITTPYLPAVFPFSSFFHVLFAFLAAVCLAVFLILLLWQLCHIFPKQFAHYPAGLFLILLFSGFLLAAAGIVSSALEIFFTISTAVFCRKLANQIAVLSISY